jgi:uncharacterized Tic20 family protein
MPGPGWYPYGGSYRWWDGQAWGPMAPPTQPGFAAYGNHVWSEEEAGRSLAIVAHLGGLFGSFLVPLIIYLVQKDENRFVRHHAAEALNFQLTLLVGYLVGFLVPVLGFVGFAAGPESGTVLGLSGVALMLLLFFALTAATWVFGIMGAVKANQREWWSYPIRIRLVR